MAVCAAGKGLRKREASERLMGGDCKMNKMGRLCDCIENGKGGGGENEGGGGGGENGTHM